MPLTPTEAHQLLDRLTAQHGELIGGQALARCLGYRTQRAFQVALQRRQVPVATFGLPGRRGRFARTLEVVRWIAYCDDFPGPPDSN